MRSPNAGANPDQRPEFNWGDLEEPHISEESPLPEGVRNTAGGIHSGIVNNSFSANIGTYMEARMPLGRLFSKNRDGEIEFWQSTPEWLGLTEDEWDALPLKERRLAISSKADKEIADHWQADPDSTGWILGQLGGMLVDPTTAIPIVGQTKMARTAYGAGIAVADMAAYETAHKGEPTFKGMATAGVLGAAAGRFLGGKTNAQIADEQIDLFNTIFPHQRKLTDDVVVAYNRTLKEMGINQDLMKRIVQESDKSKMMKLVTKKKAAQMVETELAGTLTKGKSWVPKAVDKVIQPISDRIRKINPRFWLKLEDQQRRSMELAHRTMQAVDPYLRKVEKLRWTNKKAYEEIHRAMFYGKDDIEQLTLNHLGDAAVADLRVYRNAMDELFELSKEVNPKLKYRKNYFPRWVTDYKKIKKHLGTEDMDRIKTILGEEEGELGRELTTQETNDIYNKYVQGFYDSSNVRAQPGGTKARRVSRITNELIEQAYAKPAESAHSYIKQMATDIHRKKMFKDSGVVIKDSENLTESIGAMASKFAKGGDDLDELKHLLDLLYVQGTKPPGAVTRWLKDIGYSTLLGNPLSAITQVGDIFISAGKIGTMNTLHGLSRAITGRGLSPQEFGLMDNVIEELVSTGLSKRILDKSLSIGQFKRIDRIGKATLMNGALRKFQKQAQTTAGLQQLRKKWAYAFGDDWTNVENALRKGDITPDVKTMVFSELADIQPITLLEMPELYLKYPNGRLAYMLRTFSMKFINLLRRDMLDKFAQGDRKQAIINGTVLISALNLGGITTDVAKDALLNREIDLEGTVADNLIKTSGLFNRYSSEKIATSHTPATELITTLAPPVGMWDPMTRAAIQMTREGEVSKETAADVVSYFPVIGKLYSNYAMGGLEDYNRRL